MKKFFSVLMAAVLLILPVSISACASDIPKEIDSDDWVEVQNVIIHSTYTDNRNHNYELQEFSISSTYEFNTETKDITKEEYNEELEDQFTVSLEGSIPKSRKEFIKNLSSNVKKIEHFHYYKNDEGIIANGPIDDSYYEVFTKTTCLDYTLHYVRVKFFGDGSLGINYYKDDEYTSMRIMPTSYTITYFND